MGSVRVDGHKVRLGRFHDLWHVRNGNLPMMGRRDTFLRSQPEGVISSRRGGVMERVYLHHLSLL